MTQCNENFVQYLETDVILNEQWDNSRNLQGTTSKGTKIIITQGEINAQGNKGLWCSASRVQ